MTSFITASILVLLFAVGLAGIGFYVRSLPIDDK